MKEKILVTGGAGYIGSHTVVELIRQDYEVVIIDDLSRSRESVIDEIEGITGTRPDLAVFNLCDEEKLDLFFRAHGDLAGVIHFAASLLVKESVEKPLLYYRNNLVSLINLLEVMQAHGVRPLVFSSSCTVYGQPDVLPVTEDAPVRPAESPYGNTKQVSEEIIRDTIRSGPGTEAIALRYFNPIGAHESARIGELPGSEPHHLVPYITAVAAGLRPSLKVFGDDYNTPDGTCLRDYIHVVDLARAHISATRRLLDRGNGEPFEVFNLGTGRGTSVLEMIRAFEAATGIPVPHEIAPRRDGDVEKVYADTTRANDVLGWRAELDLETMMASAWAWEKRLRERAK